MYITFVPSLLTLVCYSCRVEHFFLSLWAYYTQWGDYEWTISGFAWNNCCQPTISGAVYKICVLFSSLCTLPQSTGMSTSNACCAVCGKSFKRLQPHLAHNMACCKLYYMSRVNAAATVPPTIQNNADVNTTIVLPSKNHCTFPNLRTSLCESSAKVREARDALHHVKHLNVVSTSSGALSSGMVASASSWCIAHVDKRHLV